MKRKLKISRETLRHLVDQEVQDAVGGNASTVFTRCGSCFVTCYASCQGTCQGTVCFAC
ncbi:MAG TPA: hypothetical protein VIA62_27345 [Thermoanaerobaculia bacterium]|jgi:hypothetical protein|nr:hypothetical protein [Thermoanaerobaculia bacterium]